MIVRLIRALSAALIVPVGASLFIAGYFAYKKFGYGAVVLAALVCAGVVMFAARGAFKLAFFRPEDPAPAWQAAARSSWQPGRSPASSSSPTRWLISL